ncbi:MAG TPA: YezD family protein [Terriglobales bacterium]|nr:YezD family protein [Terriglobales bacterium]
MSHSSDRQPRENAAIDSIREALRNLRYGSVTVTVHNGAVVQVERSEKLRVEKHDA